jgi:hypothetical protein
MSAVFEAHARLLSTLPVRTHEQRVPQEKLDVERPDAIVRRQRIRELLSDDVPKKKILEILGISNSALAKHLRAIKRGK